MFGEDGGLWGTWNVYGRAGMFIEGKFLGNSGKYG